MNDFCADLPSVKAIIGGLKAHTGLTHLGITLNEKASDLLFSTLLVPPHPRYLAEKRHEGKQHPVPQPVQLEAVDECVQAVGADFAAAEASNGGVVPSDGAVIQAVLLESGHDFEAGKLSPTQPNPGQARSVVQRSGERSWGFVGPRLGGMRQC